MSLSLLLTVMVNLATLCEFDTSEKVWRRVFTSHFFMHHFIPVLGCSLPACTTWGWARGCHGGSCRWGWARPPPSMSWSAGRICSEPQGGAGFGSFSNPGSEDAISNVYFLFHCARSCNKVSLGFFCMASCLNVLDMFYCLLPVLLSSTCMASLKKLFKAEQVTFIWGRFTATLILATKMAIAMHAGFGYNTNTLNGKRQ